MDKETKKLAVQMAYASSVGIAMVLAIFGGLLFGSFLDRKLGTGHYFTFLFLIIGAVAGFRNLYLMIKKNFVDEKPVIKSVKSEPHKKRPLPKKA